MKHLAGFNWAWVCRRRGVRGGERPDSTSRERKMTSQRHLVENHVNCKHTPPNSSRHATPTNDANIPPVLLFANTQTHTRAGWRHEVAGHWLTRHWTTPERHVQLVQLSGNHESPDWWVWPSTSQTANICDVSAPEAETRQSVTQSHGRTCADRAALVRPRYRVLTSDWFAFRCFAHD